MPDITEAIEQAAIDGVQSHTVDGKTTVAVPIPDQIEAAKFVESRQAVAGTNAKGGRKSGWRSLRPARAILPEAPA